MSSILDLLGPRIIYAVAGGLTSYGVTDPNADKIAAGAVALAAVLADFVIKKLRERREASE